MKKLVVTLLVGLLALWPLVAAAQQTQQPAKPPMGETPQKQVDASKPLDQAQMRQIEERLKAAGFDPGRVDGTFTAATDKALREYQKKQGLRVAGLIGEETLTKLMTQAQTPGKAPGGATAPGASPGAKPTPSQPSPGGTTR